MRTFAALALLLVATGGCSQSPAGLVLVFPSDQDKMDATHATVLVVKPIGDGCPQFLAFPPAEPATSQLELTLAVDLKNGVPSKGLKGIPTGSHTVLVKVQNGAQVLFLHGCTAATITSGGNFEVKLQTLQVSNDDLNMTDQGPVDDLSGPGPDMTVHKILSITTTEMRTAGRKVNGALVTVTDSLGASAAQGTTDNNGNAKIEVTGMTPPFSITANVTTASNSYLGAVTLFAVTPVFTATDVVAITVPVELDPPVTSSGNIINVTIPSPGPSQSFDIYYIGSNGLAPTLAGPDLKKLTLNQGAAMPFAPMGVQPLTSSGSYRVVVVEPAQKKMWTPAAVTGPGVPIMGAPVSGFTAFTDVFSLAVIHSSNAAYTTGQSAGFDLVVPASAAQAAIPLVSPMPFVANGNQAANLPTTPTMIHPSAQVVVEVVADGASAHAEIRKQLAQPTPANDSLPAVPDPPMVTIPASTLAASPFTITATPPAGFTVATSFVHVTIRDAGALYHWHMVAPAANPTTLNVPGGIVPAGTYVVDVAFVDSFSFVDGNVQATLTDDYSKLIRPLAKELAQSTIGLTVN